MSDDGDLICSFCLRTRDEIEAASEIHGETTMVEGKAGVICNECIAFVQSPKAHVAHCASCTATEGKHEEGCTA